MDLEGTIWKLSISVSVCVFDMVFDLIYSMYRLNSRDRDIEMPEPGSLLVCRTDRFTDGDELNARHQ